MDGGDITMTNMEKLLNKLKKAKLRTPKPSYFEQYLYELDDKAHWKNRKVDAIVNEFYAVKYELWKERLIKRVFYVEQKWLNKEKQYCNIYEVQRFLAGSNKKLNKWIYSASFGGTRNQYWKSYEDCEWEINSFDRMICSSFYNYSRVINFYKMNSYEDYLKNSVQKYSGFEFSGLDEEKLFWYLYQYEKHPQMEMISKMGLIPFVQGNLQCVRWSQKGYRAIGLENKKELEIVKFCSKYGGLKYYRKHKTDIQKYRIDNDRRLTIYDVLHTRNFAFLSKKVIDYIEQQEIMLKRQVFHYSPLANDYIDYIRFCDELGCVMNSATRYPENLQQAHDDLQNKIVIHRSNEKSLKIQKQVIEHLFKYRYAKGGLVITPANSVDDLINESKALNHCVKTYADRYADGKTSIFLIRKKDDVLTPYYTLELKNGKINQVRGMHNCDPIEEVKKFICSWANKFKLDSHIYQFY